MNYLDFLKEAATKAINTIFGKEVDPQTLSLDICKKEFEGDYTLLTFPLVKVIGKAPEIIAHSIGERLLAENVISAFNVIKGFLNLSLHDGFWISQLEKCIRETEEDYKLKKEERSTYLIEYCSPNTNKPLHLGHIRNILLGWANYKILSAVGHQVNTTQVINDRGIAICKSMLAWSTWGEDKTPSSTGIKGDHFIGDYYVLFEQKFKEEYKTWQTSSEANSIFGARKNQLTSEFDFFAEYKNEYFNSFSVLGKQAREMLLAWEANDEKVIQLWKKMNAWVYQGFEETFCSLGVHFDSVYYESDTYILGKDIVEQGLAQGVFYKEPDGSSWIDLTESGLDKKIVLRSDGTSVYITQDLGTAELRHQQHHKEHYMYVVGDEQDYHFKVLFEILKKLNVSYAKGLHHLSYGMVELPTGKMKSREGTVVDADDLIAEVIREATSGAEGRGELAVLSEKEREIIFQQIAMAAIKYFILKVQPKKRMIFDPVESVDMQGHTGPYIVNAFVRIKSILRKQTEVESTFVPESIAEQEKDLIKQLISYAQILKEAAEQFDPSHLANFLYQLAKSFHRYYHDHRILNAESTNLIAWRLALCRSISNQLEHGMLCLGINMPDRM